MSKYRLRGAARQGSFFEQHSLSVILAVILIVQTVVAVWAGRHVWLGEQAAHGQPPDNSEFWIWWIWHYNVSLVADTFGVILIVLLSKRFEEIGSAESNNPGEHSKRKKPGKSNR